MYDRHVMFPRHPVLWLAALMAGGCASSQMSRIDQNRAIYETWPIETKQAVLDGKVEPGMTPEMVQVAWGRPSEIVTSQSGDEIWVYKSGGSEGSVYYPGGTMGTYPGTYPGGGIGMGGGNGVGISVGGGGTSIGTSTGIGIGSGGISTGIGSGIGGMGTGGMGPIVTPPQPPDVREVVFRNGVVHRADAPAK